MKFLTRFNALVALFLTCCASLCADTKMPNADLGNAQKIELTSALPSGFLANDTIRFTYYAPAALQNAPATGKVPAVILLHYLGISNNRQMEAIGQDIARQGIVAAVVTLPYHLQRAVPGIKPFQRFVGTEADAVVQALSQSIADVRTVTDWLLARPEVDAKLLGIVGVSLGANITHLAMGQDERLRAGVAFLGGGNLPEINRTSLAGKIFLRRKKLLTGDDLAKLRQVDPLTYAKQNQPRRVLMVQAARDIFIPPHTAEELWEALGKPPIQWIDTNHIALRFATKSATRTALAYLQAVWNNDETAVARVPKMRITTLKVGFLTGLDSSFTPAVQWQALSLGKRRHMSLLSANLGLSGRGPFVGFAATVNAFVDVGLGHRLAKSEGFTPYLSFHTTF